MQHWTDKAEPAVDVVANIYGVGQFDLLLFLLNGLKCRASVT